MVLYARTLYSTWNPVILRRGYLRFAVVAEGSKSGAQCMLRFYWARSAPVRHVSARGVAWHFRLSVRPVSVQELNFPVRFRFVDPPVIPDAKAEMPRYRWSLEVEVSTDQLVKEPALHGMERTWTSRRQSGRLATHPHRAYGSRGRCKISIGAWEEVSTRRVRGARRGCSSRPHPSKCSCDRLLLRGFNLGFGASVDTRMNVERLQGATRQRASGLARAGTAEC